MSIVNTDLEGQAAMANHLVGAAEIAKMLRITRQRVNALVQTHPDFPEPEVVLAAGRIWRREAILEWARKNDRLPRAR